MSDLSSESVSDLPSYLPNDLRSDSPCDSPSDLLTEYPSDLASDSPSQLPSDMPTDLPSHLLSDLPSDLPSRRQWCLQDGKCGRVQEWSERSNWESFVLCNDCGNRHGHQHLWYVRIVGCAVLSLVLRIAP